MTRETSQDCCCKCPCPQWAIVDPCFLKRLSNTSRLLWVSLLWRHCSFCLGPDAHKILCVCSKSLLSVSPNLVNSAVKYHWPSNSDSLGIPNPFGCSSGWKTWPGSQNLNKSGRTSLILLFSSLFITNLADAKFYFIMIVPLLPSHCSLYFVFECGAPFYYYYCYYFWWVPVSSYWWLFNN